MDGSGRWHGYVSMGLDEHGRRDRRHVTAKTRPEVVAKVRELEAQRAAGLVSKNPRAETVSDWLEHWLTAIAVHRVRPSTYVGYESKLRVHILPALGRHRLDRLQPEHLERLYSRMLRDGSSPGTVVVCHRILSRALKVATQRGRVARNVALLVQPPAAVSSEIVPLTAAEARQVLSAAAGQRNAARWTVALSLGLRQGEALGARWGDLDLDVGIWRVRQQIRRLPYRHGCGNTCQQPAARECPLRTGGLTASEPKTQRGRRNIGLPPPLLTALRSHRHEQLAERLAAGPTWHDHDLVFAQPNGKPIDPRRDHGNWKQLLHDAEVRNARLHDARHTAASLLLAQNINARTVMDILGHSSIAVTQNTYQHVMPDTVTAAISAITDVLLPPTAAPATAPPASSLAPQLAPTPPQNAPPMTP